MTPDTYLIYLVALGVFFASPPDTSQLLVISNSLRHGLRSALWTVAGDLTANSLQMTAAAFGLASIIAVSAEALGLVKWAGVAYLAWIGVGLIFARPRDEPVASARSRRPALLFRQGFLTSSANPHAVMFFGALFPQFIDPAWPVLPQLAILGGTYLLVDGSILVLWGWTARRTVGRIRGMSGVRLNRVSGAFMVLAAALLAGKDLATVRDPAR